MAKRIVTKIGDVFCAEIENQSKRYFLYIVNDMEMLNSSVIRVFKTHYPMAHKPIYDEVVKDEIEFYAHTVLRTGIVNNAWYKVGKSNNIGEDEYMGVLFGISQNCIVHSLTDIEWVDPAENWFIGHINEPRVRVGRLTEKYQHVEIDSVMPYIEIINRMRYGYYTFKI